MLDHNTAQTTVEEIPVGTPPGDTTIIKIFQDHLGLEVATALALLGSAAYKWILQPRLAKLKHSLSFSIENSNRMRGILYQLLESTQANRVLLLGFKNSEKLVNGNPLYRVFCIDEAVQRGTDAAAPFFNEGIFSSRLAGLLKRLNEEKQVWLHEPPLDSFFDQLFALQGIQGALATLLLEDNRPVGILLLTFDIPISNAREGMEVGKVKEKARFLESLLAQKMNPWLSIYLNREV